MKRLIFVVCVVMVLVLSVQPLALVEAKGGAPSRQSGATILPMRNIAKALGGEVDYNRRTGELVFTFPNMYVKMQVGSTLVLSSQGDGWQEHTSPTVITGNRGTAFIPVRFLAELVGYEVETNPGGRELIKRRTPQIPEPQPTPEPEPEDIFTSLGFPTLKHNLLPEEALVTHGVAEDILVELGDVLPTSEVLVIYRGAVNTSGYGIKTTALSIDDDELKVSVELINPLSGSINLPVQSYPYEVLLLHEPAVLSSWELHSEDILIAKGLFTTTTQQDFVRLASTELTYTPQPETPYLYFGKAKHMLVNVTESSVDVDEASTLMIVSRGYVDSPTQSILVEEMQLTDGHLKVYVEYTDSSTSVSYIPGSYYPYEVVELKMDDFKTWEIVVGTTSLAAGSTADVVEFTAVPADVDLSWVSILEAGLEQRVIEHNGEYLLVVAAKRGSFAVSGYDIAIEALTARADSTVEVLVSHIDPAPEEQVTIGVTSPYDAVSVNLKYFGREFVQALIQQEIAFSVVDSTVNDSIDLSTAGVDVLETTTITSGTVLVVKRGECPTSGYDIVVDRVTLSGSTLRIYATGNNPVVGSSVLNVLTYPYQVIGVTQDITEVEDIELIMNGKLVLQDQ